MVVSRKKQSFLVSGKKRWLLIFDHVLIIPRSSLFFAKILDEHSSDYFFSHLDFEPVFVRISRCLCREYLTFVAV